NVPNRATLTTSKVDGVIGILPFAEAPGHGRFRAVTWRHARTPDAMVDRQSASRHANRQNQCRPPTRTTPNRGLESAEALSSRECWLLHLRLGFAPFGPIALHALGDRAACFG